MKKYLDFILQAALILGIFSFGVYNILASTTPGAGFISTPNVGTVTGILPAANGGTGINNGTNNLTVPATGTAALLGAANDFTAVQTVTDGTCIFKIQPVTADATYFGNTSNHGIWFKTNNVSRLNLTADGTRLNPLSGATMGIGQGSGAGFAELVLNDTGANHGITIKTASDEAANRTLTIPPMGADKYIPLAQTGIIILSASAVLNFANTAAQGTTDLTITVTGAADGDPVFLGISNGVVTGIGTFTAWVSATDVVTIRFANPSTLAALDPPTGTFRATVFKH